MNELRSKKIRDFGKYLKRSADPAELRCQLPSTPLLSSPPNPLSFFSRLLWHLRAFLPLYRQGMPAGGRSDHGRQLPSPNLAETAYRRFIPRDARGPLATTPYCQMNQWRRGGDLQHGESAGDMCPHTAKAEIALMWRPHRHVHSRKSRGRHSPQIQPMVSFHSVSCGSFWAYRRFK